MFTVYSFGSKNDSCLTFKNVENVGATELSKDETKITLKNGNKGQKKVLTKMFEKFCWEKTKRN